MNFINYLWLVVVGILIANTAKTAAYTEQENLVYIEKILSLLNDNVECQLPSYEEISELYKSFDELRQLYGQEFESKLSIDQVLVRNTILDQWESFQKRMTEGVVIRSAKLRSFLNRVMLYQNTKFGHSICSNITNSKGLLTDRVFEKNPLVRYIKHIQTKEKIIDGPNYDYHYIDHRIFPPTVDNSPPASTAFHHLENVASDHLEAESETSETTSSDIPSYLVFDEPPIVDSDPEGLDKWVDPLANIPVPSASDYNNDAARTEYYDQLMSHRSTASMGYQTEITNPPVESINGEKTKDELKAESRVKFDKFGAELIDESEDDADLERLVRAPPQDWEFHQVYGYFKWPDEIPMGEQKVDGQRVDESIQVQWSTFLKNPANFENYLLSIQPKFNAAKVRRRKDKLKQDILREREEAQENAEFGWENDQSSISRDTMKNRWINLANNNLCKLDYNTKYFKNVGKKASNKLKSWTRPK